MCYDSIPSYGQHDEPYNTDHDEYLIKLLFPLNLFWIIFCKSQLILSTLSEDSLIVVVMLWYSQHLLDLPLKAV